MQGTEGFDVYFYAQLPPAFWRPAIEQGFESQPQLSSGSHSNGVESRSQ